MGARATDADLSGTPSSGLLQPRERLHDFPAGVAAAHRLASQRWQGRCHSARRSGRHHNLCPADLCNDSAGWPLCHGAFGLASAFRRPQTRAAQGPGSPVRPFLAPAALAAQRWRPVASVREARLFSLRRRGSGLYGWLGFTAQLHRPHVPHLAFSLRAAPASPASERTASEGVWLCTRTFYVAAVGLKST